MCANAQPGVRTAERPPYLLCAGVATKRKRRVSAFFFWLVERRFAEVSHERDPVSERLEGGVPAIFDGLVSEGAGGAVCIDGACLLSVCPWCRGCLKCSLKLAMNGLESNF